MDDQDVRKKKIARKINKKNEKNTKVKMKAGGKNRIHRRRRMRGGEERGKTETQKNEQSMNQRKKNTNSLPFPPKYYIIQLGYIY